jgi:hypothetical protein
MLLAYTPVSFVVKAITVNVITKVFVIIYGNTFNHIANIGILKRIGVLTKSAKYEYKPHTYNIL